MAGLAHVFLHVALCDAVARASSDTQIAMRVQMLYRVGGGELDKVYRFPRGDENQTVVEFDVPRGIYRLTLDVPKYRCTGTDFLTMLPDRDRNVSEKLVDADAAQPQPVQLMNGTAPISFLYVKPTFVLFDKSVTCNAAVAPPVPAAIDLEYDQGSYYAWLRPDAALAARGPLVVALRLRTPTGSAHYVRIPITYPTPWGGWPSDVNLDVTEDMIDGLATEKVDTLLCLKFWETSVH